MTFAGIRWRHRHTVLSVAVLAYFSIRFSEFVLSPIVPQVEEGLGISTAVVGVAFTASTAAYALAQLPSGALGDRFGERMIVLAAIGLTGVGSLLLAASPSGFVLVLAMTLVGAVSGAYYSPATSLLVDLFEDTGRAIGIHRLGAQLVGFTAPVVAVVAVAYGWRVALLLGAIVALPVFVVFRSFVRPREPIAPNTSIRKRLRAGSLADLLSRPSIAFTTILASFAQFADTATFSFLPAILQEYHGFSLGTAGLLFTVYFTGLTISQPIAGWASDRFGTDLTTVITLISGVSGFVLLLTFRDLAIATIATVLVGIGMSWGPPVQARFMGLFSESSRGMGFGLVRTVYIGFAALGGVVIGSIVTVSGWPLALTTLAFMFALPVLALGANWALGVGL